MTNVIQFPPRPRPVSAHEQHVHEWVASHMPRPFAAASNDSGELALQILDVIGASWLFEGVTANSVKVALDAAPNAKPIRVLLDSRGGDVFDAGAIRTLLAESGATVHVDVIGEASSAATIIAMAASPGKLVMHPASMMMVH